MKLREHRGSLDDSLATMVEIEGTRQALLEVVQRALAPWGLEVTAEQLEVLPYTFDRRLGWNTHIVVIKGYGPFGLTDGPLTD